MGVGDDPGEEPVVGFQKDQIVGVFWYRDSEFELQAG